MNRIRKKLSSLRSRATPFQTLGRGDAPKARSSFDATTFIAALALVVSAVQLFATAPLISQWFIKPQLVVEQEHWPATGKKLGSRILVKNLGTAVATKIEVGVAIIEGQEVAIIPRLSARIVGDESKFFKHLRVELDHLQPDEVVEIHVTNRREDKPKTPFFSGFSGQPPQVVLEFPNVTFVRSAEGRGQVKQTPLPTS